MGSYSDEFLAFPARLRPTRTCPLSRGNPALSGTEACLQASDPDLAYRLHRTCRRSQTFSQSSPGLSQPYRSCRIEALQALALLCSFFIPCHTVQLGHAFEGFVCHRIRVCHDPVPLQRVLPVAASLLYYRLLRELPGAAPISEAPETDVTFFSRRSTAFDRA